MTFADFDWTKENGNHTQKKEQKIQTVALNDSTYIFRQNLWVHPEAPFMYLLLGQKQVLLYDTGATVDEVTNPLREMVFKIIAQHEHRIGAKISLIVAHSHSHYDHIAGDNQFRNQPLTSVVGSTLNEVQTFFGFTKWPEQSIVCDLGNRPLVIIPTPGHDATDIAIYDRQTKILLTGDTLYPGRLYIDNFPKYKKSIARLAVFAANHPIEQVLGCHIEMSKISGRDFPEGSSHHPNEHSLPLTVDHLNELNRLIIAMADHPTRVVRDDFIITP